MGSQKCWDFGRSIKKVVYPVLKFCFQGIKTRVHTINWKCFLYFLKFITLTIKNLVTANVCPKCHAKYILVTLTALWKELVECNWRKNIIVSCTNWAFKSLPSIWEIDGLIVHWHPCCSDVKLGVHIKPFHLVRRFSYMDVMTKVRYLLTNES